MLNENGHEVPDPRPMARPLHISAPETLAQQIQRMVRSELSRRAEAQGFETFEEAEDFDVGDEPELASPYELHDSNFEETNARDDQRASDGKPGGEQATNGDAAAAAPRSPALGESGTPAQAGGRAGTDGSRSGAERA